MADGVALKTTKPQSKSVADYRKRGAALLVERQKSWDAHWQTIADYLLPRRVRFNVTERNRGGMLNQNIIDSTPLFAVRTLASGMMSSITSPSRNWFRLTTADPVLMDDYEVRGWLWNVEERMREVFQKTNLYNCLQQLYGDLIPFGTAPMLMTHDPERLVRFFIPPIGSYSLACTKGGRVDTIYRNFSMTAAQCVSEFGDACSDRVLTMVKNNQHDEWVDITHCIEPNLNAELGRFDNRNLGWTDVYFETTGNEDKFLRESGHWSCPLAAPRWDITGEDVYGRGPGMDALGDIKALQLLSKRMLQLVDKMSAPPLAVSSNMRMEKISLLSGDVSYVDTPGQGEGVRPILTIPPQGLAEVRETIREHQERIGRAFFVDLWLALTAREGPEMTAREIEERHLEKMSLLGPVLERLENELLDVIIERAFDMMLRGGLCPLPIPQALARAEVRVEYLSIMAQAQKYAGTMAINQFSSYVASMAQIVPEMIDRLDVDEAAEEMATALGAPPRLLRSLNEAKKMRAARAAAAQAAQQAEQAKAAQAGSAALKNLSETTVGGKPALDRLAGAAVSTPSTPQTYPQ